MLPSDPRGPLALRADLRSGSSPSLHALEIRTARARRWPGIAPADPSPLIPRASRGRGGTRPILGRSRGEAAVRECRRGGMAGVRLAAVFRQRPPGRRRSRRFLACGRHERGAVRRRGAAGGRRRPRSPPAGRAAPRRARAASHGVARTVSVGTSDGLRVVRIARIRRDGAAATFTPSPADESGGLRSRGRRGSPMTTIERVAPTDLFRSGPPGPRVGPLRDPPVRLGIPRNPPRRGRRPPRRGDREGDARRGARSPRHGAWSRSASGGKARSTSICAGQRRFPEGRRRSGAATVR